MLEDAVAVIARFAGNSDDLGFDDLNAFVIQAAAVNLVQVFIIFATLLGGLAFVAFLLRRLLTWYGFQRGDAQRRLMKAAYWVIGLTCLFLAFMVSHIHLSPLPFGLAIVSWLILTSLAASTGLIIHHRAFFCSWLGWPLPLLLLILSNSVVTGGFSIHSAPILLFFTLLAIVSGWAVVLTTVSLLWYRDVGLRFIAWGAVIMVWGMALAWRVHGNLMAHAFHLTQPNPPPSLWWRIPLLFFLFLLIPFGMMSFLGHTIRLVIREKRTFSLAIRKGGESNASKSLKK